MTPRTFAFVGGLAIVLLIACIDNIANGAEREGDTVWVVVACMKHPIERGCYEIGEPMETRTDCAIAVERVAVRMSGAWSWRWWCWRFGG